MEFLTMRYLKIKSIVFFHLVWLSLFGLIAYNTYKKLANLDNISLRPLKLDEIFNSGKNYD